MKASSLSQLTIADGERAIEILTTQLGFPRLPCHFTFKRPGVRFASYDELGHAVDEEELEDLAEWLQCCLAE
jgi:lysophospholipase-2